MVDNSTGRDSLRRWPDPEPGQIEVMLLGVYHMANPGQDEHNLEADDVLADPRQRELETLVDRLGAWEPDYVAVEWPRDRQSEVSTAYEAYRAGELDGPVGELERRNEIVQLGFRLAARKDHQSVSAIDHKLPMDAHLDESEDVSLGDFPDPEAVEYPLPDPEAMIREENERLAESTISEFLVHLNREEQLRLNGSLTLAAGLTHDGEREHAGARLATAWYERNLRIVENLWDAVDATHERVCVPIGSAHVKPLRHFLDEVPMFCPVSPLSYL